MFYSVILLENGIPMLENITLQIPSSFTKEDLSKLLKETYNKSNYSLFMIKNLEYEGTLESMAQTLNIISEDTIEINCLTSTNCDLWIETDDIITSMLYNEEKNELILSLINKKINYYINFKLEKVKETLFTVKKIVDENSFISFDNDFVKNDKILLKNVTKFCQNDKFLTKDGKIFNINQEILIQNDNTISNFYQNESNMIYLNDKNEIIKNNKIFFTLENEIIFSSFFSENSIICTNKLVYLISKENEIKTTKSVFPIIDSCCINDEYFFTICYNKLSIQRISDFHLIKLIEIDKQITNLEVKNKLILISTYKKVLIYKIK